VTARPPAGMSTDGAEPVYVAGAYEHPVREATDRSTPQLHAEAAAGALDDAGVDHDDVDGYLTANVPENEYGLAPLVMADYLGLDVGFADTTDYGGSSYMSHVGHAAGAIRNGRCDVALVTMAGRPRSAARDDPAVAAAPDSFEAIYGLTTPAKYAVAARRHAHEYGTTPEQLAAIRVAAASHARHNPDALYRDPVTVADVVDSRIVADPLHLLDCCVVSDGAGALVVLSADARARLDVDRECAELLGHGEAVGGFDAGRIDLTHTAAVDSGPRAFAEAGLGPEHVEYASIYDSFTITVLQTIEDLGFCEKGAGGAFVEGGTLRADGDLPFNTDGGGLCSNHPDRGGMFRTIEAVRQLRGETAPEVRVDPDVALAHGTGGSLGTRHGSVTLLLGSEDR